jgi:hypothetical protein
MKNFFIRSSFGGDALQLRFEIMLIEQTLLAVVV